MMLIATSKPKRPRRRLPPKTPTLYKSSRRLVLRLVRREIGGGVNAALARHAQRLRGKGIGEARIAAELRKIRRETTAATVGMMAKFEQAAALEQRNIELVPLEAKEFSNLILLRRAGKDLTQQADRVRGLCSNIKQNLVDLLKKAIERRKYAGKGEKKSINEDIKSYKRSIAMVEGWFADIKEITEMGL